LYFLESFC